MLFQPHHHLPKLRLFLIGGMDFFRGFLADTPHLPEPVGLLFDNLQGHAAEFIHNAGCHCLAYALNSAGGQKAPDALHPCRGGNNHVHGIELGAEPWVLHPSALQIQLLPLQGRSHLHRYGHGAFLPLRQQPEHAKAPLRAGKYDIVHYSRQGFQLILHFHDRHYASVSCSHFSYFA